MRCPSAPPVPLPDEDLVREVAAVGNGDLLETQHLREIEEGVEVLHAELGERRQQACHRRHLRSEEHTSELQSLMRISYAVFCLKKKNKKQKEKQIQKITQSQRNQEQQNNTKTQHKHHNKQQLTQNNN